jgi:hypothetical protein
MLSSAFAFAQLDLEVEGGARKSIAAQEWAAMPHQSVTVTNPHTKEHKTYEGVLLRRVLDEMGVAAGEKIRGAEFRNYIVVSAKDGYAVVLALAEVDPSLQKNQIMVADRVDGKPLDEKHGPFQLVVPEDERPARWVRMVTKISVQRTH